MNDGLQFFELPLSPPVRQIEVRAKKMQRRLTVGVDAAVKYAALLERMVRDINMVFLRNRKTRKNRVTVMLVTSIGVAAIDMMAPKAIRQYLQQLLGLASVRKFLQKYQIGLRALKHFLELRQII